MASVKQLRLRIKSIKSTKKITKAMQMVSAAKLRKNRLVLDESFAYRDAVEDAMHNTLAAGSDLSTIAKAALGLNVKSHDVKLIIIVGSDRGLCGGFNHAVLRMVRKDISEYLERGIQFKIIVIGKKPAQILNSYYKDHIIEMHNNLVFDAIHLRDLSSRVMGMLSSNEKDKIGSCDVYFSSFKNTVQQIPDRKQIFPVVMKKSEGVHGVCEVEGENLIEKLLSIYIIAQIQNVILDSRTSEEASRTTAMDNATRNAEDMIQKLTLSMNRSRQAMITKELIEIISGAEAV